MSSEEFVSGFNRAGHISLEGEVFASVPGVWRKSVKRLLDVAVSAICLIVLAPLFLVVGLAIVLDSKGPVFFCQTRWGRAGKKIDVYKFRSMVADECDLSGVRQTVIDDPRVTAVGRFLRRTNIDELPQLFNVLKGEMSLVGPRCHVVGMKAAGIPYEQLVPRYHDRHLMRPGITGLAQMRGLRGPTESASRAKARIASDLHYVENFSLLLDLKIIVGTIRNEIFGGTGF